MKSNARFRSGVPSPNMCHPPRHSSRHCGKGVARSTYRAISIDRCEQWTHLHFAHTMATNVYDYDEFCNSGADFNFLCNRSSAFSHIDDLQPCHIGSFIQLLDLRRGRYIFHELRLHRERCKKNFIEIRMVSQN